MIAFEELIEAARHAVARREQERALESLREMVRTAPASKDALAALRAEGRAVSVIAEVKRATVTEPVYSNGDLRDLDAVRGAVDVPVLVNDLIVTPYQVHEARAHGADLLKLDARLDPLILESLIERTASLGMLAVVEAHSRREAITAVENGARCVAVDARDPDTLEVDPSRFEQVAEVLPTSVLRVAEGGVSGARDVMDYARAGADVVLVGEALIRSADPQQFVAQLVAAGSHPSLLTAIHREAL